MSDTLDPTIESQVKEIEVRKLDLGENGVLAIRLPDGTTHNSMRMFMKEMTRVFGQDRVFAYIGDLDFTVVDAGIIEHEKVSFDPVTNSSTRNPSNQSPV